MLLMVPPTLAQPCAPGTFVAYVTYVRDGDTIEVGGLPIRLNGLAAPEGDEPGGIRATEAMRQMALGQELRCELNGERTHDRKGHRRSHGATGPAALPPVQRWALW